MFKIAKKQGLSQYCEKTGAKHENRLACERPLLAISFHRVEQIEDYQSLYAGLSHEHGLKH